MHGPATLENKTNIIFLQVFFLQEIFLQYSLCLTVISDFSSQKLPPVALNHCNLHMLVACT